MNPHRLDGCAPAPLANYLKALGILRLVAEQLDAQARGWWDGERFVLASAVGEDELLQFLLERYAPTPMLNPWGARSGFYSGSSESTSRELLSRIAESAHPRFSAFAASVAIARESIIKVTGGKKPDEEKEGGKAELVRDLKARLRGPASAWLEAVIAIVDTSAKGLQQPSLWGTGGSEGSGSYTAAYMKALNECLIDRAWDGALRHSVFGNAPGPAQDWPESFGQFLPSGVGSPWDLLLAFEGACLVRSSVAKRSDSAGDRWVSSPFFVAPSGVGAPSTARLDEFALNKGKELPGRGEQWFPIWSAPATLAEVSHVFRDGRAVVGRSRPQGALSMARAAARLGVARGVTRFVRYGYLQRNNLATHFAVPLGRFDVPDRPEPTLACLDDLDTWLRRLRREARSDKAPARLVLAERRLSEALLAVTQRAAEPARWQVALLRMAEIEALQVRGTGAKAGAIPRLRPQWVSAADDGSVELRLAVAFALQCADARAGARRDGVRRHWVALDGEGDRNERVVQGRDGIDDAIALVARRLLEAGRAGVRRLPLEPGFGVAASRHDVARLIAGEVDLDHCLALARALMAIDPQACARRPPRVASAPPADWPDDAWIAIRLALLPWPLPDGRAPGCDPAILRRLRTDDLAAAVQLAARRLHIAGIHCPIGPVVSSTRLARRYAAALAFPINRHTATALAARLDPSIAKENAA
ncbi:MAG: type I-U CRISPR-associated protein Csx17 [Rubrivivax sp.]|nr:type I-U CRISPR-associated protein Csx17 [Rubrivivax sp.]